MTNEQLTLSRPQRGVLGHIALEAGAWLVALCTVSLGYAIAGMRGFTGSLPPGELDNVTAAQRDGQFDQGMAVLGLLCLAVLILLGLLVPTATVRRLGPDQRTLMLTVTALVTAAAGIVFAFVTTLWMGLIVAASLGVLATILAAHTPQLHRKPWRTAGIATGLLLLTVYLFQLNGGAPAGTAAARWLLIFGAVVLAVSGVLVLFSPLDKKQLPDDTAGFPLTRSLKASRGHMDVSFAWACYALFVLLGSVFILALPSVADQGYGQGGFVLIVAAALVGWAAGFEAGPTFAPGMTRPRLTSIALIVGSVLTIGAGLVTELSGTAVLTALVTFSVGVGVRAQVYSFSRRVGIAIGVFLALLIACLDINFEIDLSAVSVWTVTGSQVAYLAIGILGLLTGIVALFAFSPQGVQGLGVDLIYAFRSPAETTSGGPHVLLQENDVHPAAAQPAAAESGAADGAPAAHAPAASAGAEAPLAAVAARTSDSGLFIAVEGGDGAGKSTQVERLREYFAARGYQPVIVTREPGGTEKGRAIRSVLLDGDGVTQRSEALLFAADRAHHVASLVSPTLARGGVVITDRYIDSSLAYQAGGRELSQADVLALSRWATEGLTPHLTIVLDIDPTVAAERLSARGEHNHLDTRDLEFKQRVRTGFLALAQVHPERYLVIDANQAPDAVADELAARLTARLQEGTLGAAVPAESAIMAGTEPGSGGPADALHRDAGHGESPHPAGSAGESLHAAGSLGEKDEAADDAPTRIVDRTGADRFTPAATRGRFDGVPTERMSEDDMRREYGDVPEFLTDSASSEEAETTVLPARNQAQPTAQHEGRHPAGHRPAGPRPDADEAETTVLPANHGVAAAEAETTVLRANRAEDTGERQSRRPNLDRLKAQARIERQARERLREARERGSN